MALYPSSAHALKTRSQCFLSQNSFTASCSPLASYQYGLRSCSKHIRTSRIGAFPGRVSFGTGDCPRAGPAAAIAHARAHTRANCERGVMSVAPRVWYGGCPASYRRRSHGPAWIPGRRGVSMPQPSTRTGMGAIPYPGGVTFRVWAPFAPNVFVAGDFNNWDEAAAPVASEGNGNWSLDVAGAAVGQKYKFKVGGQLRIDPHAARVTNSVGDGIIESPDFAWRVNDFRIPPWNELVVYELHVGTFPDQPTVPGKMIDTVIQDLWYLQELGVNTIEVMPTGEFPQDRSWGYNPAHIFAVESAYGGPDALKRLVDACHARGIAVILDVVYNHFGPNDLSIWQFDGWFQRWLGQEMGGIYFYNDWRAWTKWGEKNRPDYGRGEVRQFIRDNALRWLEEFRLDGLRFDMTVFIRNVYGHNDDPTDNQNNFDGWGWNLLK